MRKNLLLIILFLGGSQLFLFSLAKVDAAKVSPTDCDPTYNIPYACQNNYEPDLNCVSKKFTNPGDKCCINKCKNDPLTPLATQYRQFEVFGTSFRLNPEAIPGLINLAFSTFLSIVSVYALLRGMYVAGVKRPAAINDEDIAKVQKELTQLVVGFVIAWAFILIIQIIANILGVGQLNQLDITSQKGDNSNLVVQIN